MKKKLIVVVGPTASGKSSLAVSIAKHRNGEIISADSRQIYRGMDIGTGKITRREMERIPHHLLDIAGPARIFSVAQYQRRTRTVLNSIYRRGKLPILCGGTGLYIRSIVDGIVIPEVSPDRRLRNRLNTLPVAKLYTILKKLDPARAKTIDRKNPRRLVRAIEIAKKLGSVPPLSFRPFEGEVLILGIKKTREELKPLIRARLIKRLRNGMVTEVKRLHEQGLSWKRLEDLGLEYRYTARYLKKNITRAELLSVLEYAINQYAKRQMTWFRKDKRIHWVSKKNEAERLVSRFLKP